MRQAVCPCVAGPRTPLCEWAKVTLGDSRPGQPGTCDKLAIVTLLQAPVFSSDVKFK